MESRRLRRVLAANIRRQLARKKMAVNSLADFAGVARSQLYDVLGRRKAPTTDWLARVAKALGVEPWELLKPEK